MSHSCFQVYQMQPTILQKPMYSHCESLYHELKPFGVDILAAPSPEFWICFSSKYATSAAPNQVAPQILKALGNTPYSRNTYQDSNLCLHSSDGVKLGNATSNVGIKIKKQST